jgi:hypothetical protein
VTGPEEREQPRGPEQSSGPPPPGHFLSQELESDCARFLEQVRTLVARREHESAARREASLGADRF